MNFSKELKPVYLLWPILLGLITFSVTVIYLNCELKWPAKRLIILQKDSTYFRQNFANELYSMDTLFTPYKLADGLESKENRTNLFYTNNIVYNRYPLLLVWIMSVGILVGLGFSFIPVYYMKIREYGFKWQFIILSMLIIFIVFVPQIFVECFSGQNLLLPKNIEGALGIGFSNCALLFNSFVPFVPVAFWIVAVISVLVASFKSKNEVEKLLIIKSEFELLFVIISISLGLSIFTNNVFNIATNQILNVSDNFKILPHEFAYINAIIYSFVLVMTYIYVGGYFNTLIEKNYLNQSNNQLHDLKKGKSFLKYVGITLTLLAPIIGSGIADILKLIIS